MLVLHRVSSRLSLASLPVTIRCLYLTISLLRPYYLLRSFQMLTVAASTLSLSLSFSVSTSRSSPPYSERLNGNRPFDCSSQSFSFPMSVHFLNVICIIIAPCCLHTSSPLSASQIAVTCTDTARTHNALCSMV